MIISGVKGLVVEVVEDHTTPLPSSINNLSYLWIKDVPEFKQLPFDFLPNNMHLRDLYIASCPQFQGFLGSSSSSGHCLQFLRLDDCPSILRLQLQGFTQLQELTVEGCTGLQSLEGLQSLSNLQGLEIGRFSEELDYFPFFDEFAEMGGHPLSSLRRLTISGWSGLKSLPEQIQHLTRLEQLYIHDFDGITELPEWLGRLTSLRWLWIERCKELVHLPSRKLTSLTALTISGCPLLKERCKPPMGGLGAGSEWHKISHIPDVGIYPYEDEDAEDEDRCSSLSRFVNKMHSKVC